MGIDDISGKVSAFWLRAKSALSATPSDTPATPQAGPRARGDSVDLPHRGQYFAGYAFPDPAETAAGASAAPGASDATIPDAGGKVWAPLVINPFEGPEP